MKICNLHNLRFEERKDKIITNPNVCIQNGESPKEMNLDEAKVFFDQKNNHQS